MSRHGIPIGRIFGIAIDLDYSWFVIVGLMTWTLAVGYFPREFSGWIRSEYWLIGFAATVLLFASVLIHELSHSIVAQRVGIAVPRITLFLFGGVSQIATEASTPGAEFWISVMGPITSVILAAFFWEVEPLVSPIRPLFALTKYLAMINAVLAVFNLVPGYPLDGGRILRAFLWRTTHNHHRATIASGIMGRFFGFLLIFWGIWLALAGNLGSGIWIALIGWFLESAAASQIQQEGIKSLLDGHLVADAMRRDVIEVPETATVQDLVRQASLTAGSRPAVVTHEGVPEGIVTLAEIQAMPRNVWPTTRAAQIMIPLKRLITTRPDAVLWSALEKMGRDGANQLVVLDGNRIVGVLTRGDILHYLTGLRPLAA
jgi:Zn-dependent protease/CBS domain-containing protein